MFTTLTVREWSSSVRLAFIQGTEDYDTSDLLYHAANHRNLLLASSVKLDEMRDQYDYRSPFPEWCFAELRTLFLQNINNIISNYHLRIRIPMRQAQHQVFYTQLLHLISIITSVISGITSIISIPTFKEVKSEIYNFPKVP